jgi:hypothetical protein
VQLFEPRAGFYWYTRPAALVTQSFVSHGSIDAIAAHNDIVDELLALRGDEIKAAGGLLVFCDWRSVKTYDLEARALQRDRMIARPPWHSRRTIVVVEPRSRLLAMAADWLNFLTALTVRNRIEIATRVDEALERANVSVPGPGATLFP